MGFKDPWQIRPGQAKPFPITGPSWIILNVGVIDSVGFFECLHLPTLLPRDGLSIQLGQRFSVPCFQIMWIFLALGKPMSIVNIFTEATQLDIAC